MKRLVARRRARRTRIGRVGRVRRVAGVLAVALLAALFVRLGPLPRRVMTPAAATASVFLDRNGVPLAPGEPPRRPPGSVPLSVRADRLAAATLAAEDRRFFSHSGIDPLAIAHTIVTNLRGSGGGRRGASTITQQLVKLRLGRPRRTYLSKARELTYAERLEHRMSKTAILSAYLAEAPYGGQVNGAERAAALYFAKAASQLSWAEAAYLAALPNRPTAYNPRRRPGAARVRQHAILSVLRSRGSITDREYRAAIAERLHLVPGERRPLAPHFTEMLAQRLAARHQAPSRIVTTIDAPLQRDVEGVVRHARPILTGVGAANAAIVVLDNRTGDVLAWEGSGDYLDLDHGGMINGPLVARQTGSVIKPFVYALAFERGAMPRDLVDDAPTVFQGNGVPFEPENYDHRYRGTLSMREALASSVNVPAVKLASDLGVERLGALLDRAGMHLAKPARTYGLSLALGAGELDLLSVTRAFSMIVRGGEVIEPRFMAGDPVGRTTRVVNEETAFLLADVLSDNEARTPAFGSNSALRFAFPVAAKTGTSQDFHDNWVVGASADATVGVWVGNFDRTPLKGATGVTGAGPIFHAVMVAAHDRLHRTARNESATALVRAPETLRFVERCATAACTSTIGDYERVVAGAPTSNARRSLPIGAPPLLLIDPVPSGRYLLDPNTPSSTQRLPLRASGGVPPYAFAVDDVEVAATDGSPAALWPLLPGTHHACVDDVHGGRRCASFRVELLPKAST